ncbi:MAG: FHA domain-containing protein [Planctomycetes bacterium]|nr:FHA domain-containing protein [Planctomycetota bacterium]
MQTRDLAYSPAPGGEPKLVFRTGPSRGKVFVLEGDRLSLGRGAQCDVVVPDDIVSSLHAVIGRASDGTCWIKDSGSKNGTYVNGRRIQEVTPLSEGDLLCLAQAGPEIQFTSGEPELPSLIGTSTATLARTRSLKALLELLPQAARGRVTGNAGVHELEGCRLEEVSRRSRRAVFHYFVGVGVVLLLAVLVILQLQLRDRLSPAASSSTGISIGGAAPSPSPGAGQEEKLDAGVQLDIQPIYGSLFHSYRDHPIGKVLVVNRGASPLEGARLLFDLFFSFEGKREDFLVEDLVLDVPSLAPGESWDHEIRPVLSTQILSPRDREVTASIALEEGGRTLASQTRAALVYGRHVFNWEEPERIAAFIDAEDPAVLAFINEAWSIHPETSRDEFPPRRMVDAVTVLTALAERGIRYLSDAQTPNQFAASSRVNDRVKYPGETLIDGTGDCDDLSVLCCSLLKAVGIPAAFVVGADHVLFLFDSGLEEALLDESPFDPETVIPWKGRIWIPVESTRLAGSQGSFLAAWTAAWKRRRSIVEDEMQIVDVQDAWRRYKPFPPAPDRELLDRIQRTDWLSENDVALRVEETLESLRQLYLKNLSGKIEELDKDLEGLARAQAVGLLYARSGLYSLAIESFEKAVFPGGAPQTRAEILGWQGEVGGETAVVLGNLALTLSLGARSSEELDRAAALFELSLRGIPEEYPERAEIMLRIALIRSLGGDILGVREWTARAYRIDPALERTFAALVEGDGTVAGENPRIFRYLEEGLRSSLKAPESGT